MDEIELEIEGQLKNRVSIFDHYYPQFPNKFIKGQITVCIFTYENLLSTLRGNRVEVRVSLLTGKSLTRLENTNT